MPFDDEISAAGVLVVPYRPSWPGEFELLGGSLASVLGAHARRIDHVGSTSVPGLAAKDCLDVSVSVDDVAEPSIDDLLTGAGYRQRPEPWNRVERSFGIASSKLVYAPPVGGRAVNIHVRTLGGPGARYSLVVPRLPASRRRGPGRVGSVQAPARTVGARHLRLRPDQDACHRSSDAGCRALGRCGRLDTVSGRPAHPQSGRVHTQHAERTRATRPLCGSLLSASLVRPSCGSAS